MKRRKKSKLKTVKQWNKELKEYQLKVLGYTTGEATGDVLRRIQKQKNKQHGKKINRAANKKRAG